MSTYIHLVMRTDITHKVTEPSRSYAVVDDAYRMADYLNTLEPRHYNFWVLESVPHDNPRVGNETVI